MKKKGLIIWAALPVARGASLSHATPVSSPPGGCLCKMGREVRYSSAG